MSEIRTDTAHFICTLLKKILLIGSYQSQLELKRQLCGWDDILETLFDLRNTYGLYHTWYHNYIIS